MSAVLEARESSTQYLEVTPPLVQQFELLATAPGGVARLRKLILSLAVQGKLTARDCDKELASILLERIRDRKLRLIASEAIKQRKPPPEVGDAGPLFELPKGWTWARLGELCSYIQRGKGPAYAEQSEHKVISQKCVRWYGLDLAPARSVTPESLAKYEPVRLLRAGDLLWNSTGTGTIGRACVVPIELDDAGLVADSHVTVVRPLEVSSLFLWRWIQSPFVQDEIEGSASGTTNQIELNTSTVVNQPVPLPPMAEQLRIVARVDELMRLCDALEAQGRLEAEQHARLLGTLLGTLTDSSTPEELAANWQLVADHFDLLLDRPEAVDALERSILQLATSGQLISPQPPCKAGSDQVTEPLALDEPFELPASWIWVTLGQLSTLVTSGSRSWKDFYTKEGSTFIRSQDIKGDCLEFDSRAYVKLPPSAEGVRTQVQVRDVLITITGANVGKAAVLSEPINDAYVSQHVGLVRLRDPRMAEYVHLWLVNKLGGRRLLLESSYGAKPGLNLKNLKDLPVPLPPLAEQAEILARVTELRRLCADLRQRLTASQTTQSHLAEALADHAAA